MKSSCLKCRKDTGNIDPKFSSNSNSKAIILSVCNGRKKSRFIKNQEAKVRLSNLGIKTPLSKVPILGDILFCGVCIKITEVVDKFLLTGDKFMPEMHLKQPRFTYSAFGPFTKTKETSYIYKL